MSGSKVHTAHIDNPIVEAEAKEEIDRARSPGDSLRAYALLGGAALLLLSLIEWTDLSGLPFTFFESLSDRVILALYLSLNVLIGLLIGVMVGLFVRMASFLKNAIEKIIWKKDEPKLVHRLLVSLGMAAGAAFLLNQQSHINRYIIGMIREAEKFTLLRSQLLNHERATSYLILMALVAGCWVIWRITRTSRQMHSSLRVSWLFFLAASIGFLYYIDSRIEVQLYEYTLHRSMYVLNLIMAMALVGSVLTTYTLPHGLHS